MVVNPNELYKPVTWAYQAEWSDPSASVRTVRELLNGEIGSWNHPPEVMGEVLSAAEFVALWEWLPINQTRTKEYLDSDGYLTTVIFEFEMTAQQRAEWFY